MPMDRSAVEALVGRELGPLKDRLGLGHWDIKVKYGPIDGNAAGQCSRQYDYDRATIELDPEELDDEGEALRVLRHELFHVVLAPYDLFANSVRAVDLPESMWDVLHNVWQHSCEKVVIQLERMYSGLTKL